MTRINPCLQPKHIRRTRRWQKRPGKTLDMTVTTLQILGRMIAGQASLKNLSGPVSIAQYAGQTAQMGVVAFLGFLAIVSISLAVLNLLPIPLLDGGHLFYYLLEFIKGSPVSDFHPDAGPASRPGTSVQPDGPGHFQRPGQTRRLIERRGQVGEMGSGRRDGVRSHNAHINQVCGSFSVISLCVHCAT